MAGTRPGVAHDDPARFLKVATLTPPLPVKVVSNGDVQRLVAEAERRITGWRTAFRGVRARPHVDRGMPRRRIASLDVLADMLLEELRQGWNVAELRGRRPAGRRLKWQVAQFKDDTQG